MQHADIHALMQQGNNHLNNRNFSAAKDIYLRVLQQTTEQADAYFGLGWIAFNEKDVEQACNYLRSANSLQPANKTYLSSLVDIYLQTGQFEPALELLENYLAREPNQVDMLFKLGNVYANTKQTDKAIEAFKNCIRLHPQELQFYMSIGQIHYYLLEYKEALAIYLQALNANLKSEGLYLNIAKLQTDFGEIDAAKATLTDAVAAYPDSLVFHYRLGDLDKQAYSTELRQKLTRLNTAALSPDNQFYHQWLLSKFAFQEQRPIEEMKHLQNAHKLFKSISQFSHDSEFYLKNLKRLTLPNPKALDNLTPLNDVCDAPIFIIGTPRCGSTLIENIICNGPQEILRGEEPSVVLQALDHAVQSTDEEFWPTLQDKLGTGYQQAGLTKDGLRFTDKSLENIFLVDFIMALFPNAKIVYCERNPLASIVSILKNNLVSLPWAHDIDEIFEYVDNCLNAAKDFAQRYPKNFYTINYEEFILSQETESKNLMEFCGLPWNEDCLSFGKTKGLMSKTASHTQIRNKINKNSLSAYQAYLPFFEAYKQKYNWVR